LFYVVYIYLSVATSSSSLSNYLSLYLLFYVVYIYLSVATSLLAGGMEFVATGEKKRNLNPELLVATGVGMGRTSFARSAAEAPRVARMGADDAELPAASERAETRSAGSA
jgi:hypothetical protein